MQRVATFKRILHRPFKLSVRYNTLCDSTFIINWSFNGYNYIRFSSTLLLIYVSESDILGPIAYFSDIEKLVTFERAMFEDYNFKYRTKIFLLFMSISPR